eukprot:1575544-Amphidinium_carterae.1
MQSGSASTSQTSGQPLSFCGTGASRRRNLIRVSCARRVSRAPSCASAHPSQHIVLWHHQNPGTFRLMQRCFSALKIEH